LLHNQLRWVRVLTRIHTGLRPIEKKDVLSDAFIFGIERSGKEDVVAAQDNLMVGIQTSDHVCDGVVVETGSLSESEDVTFDATDEVHR
jgi:hypothetical protein